jgi:hypothetical protein
MKKYYLIAIMPIFILSTACGIDASRVAENNSIEFLEFENTENGLHYEIDVSRITESNLVGVWELEDAENRPRSELASRLEFFSDGTGIFDNITVTWQLIDGDRLHSIRDTGSASIFDIELTEEGTLLIYHYDGRDYSGERQRKRIYKKK